VNVESDKKCPDNILFHAEKIILCFFLYVFFSPVFCFTVPLNSCKSIAGSRTNKSNKVELVINFIYLSVLLI